MRDVIKKDVLEKLELVKMKYAAMDKNRKWYAFEQKPDCVDDMWDAKEGRSEKIVDRAVETSDWRSSLVELETFIED